MDFGFTTHPRDTDGPLTLEMSLSSGSVMVGEPIVLRCRVTNTLVEEVQTYMGRDPEDWLGLMLLNEAGGAVPALQDPRPENPGGIHADGARISPNGHYDGYAILNRHFALTLPGQHRLTVSVHLPYAVGRDEVQVSSERFEDVLGTVVRAKCDFAFAVTEPEPVRLRAIAEGLREAIFLPNSKESGLLPLQCLFSMPEEYALPSWQALGSDPRIMFIGQFVADELARISSLAAAHLLAEVVWNPPPEALKEFKHYRASVRWQFHSMYFHSSPPVQRFIADVLVAHGQDVPTAPVLVSD